jgi:hypothetical protein
MSHRQSLGLAVLLALVAALPAGSALADDICRRPCIFFVPQKGEADPTAFGCGDLIENLSGTCGISIWDLRNRDDVRITVRSTPRPYTPPLHANRQRLWIELG